MQFLNGIFASIQIFSVKDYIQENVGNSKIVSEYDQEIPQSQTANNPMAPRGRATQPS